MKKTISTPPSHGTQRAAVTKVATFFGRVMGPAASALEKLQIIRVVASLTEFVDVLGRLYGKSTTAFWEFVWSIITSYVHLELHEISIRYVQEVMPGPGLDGQIRSRDVMALHIRDLTLSQCRMRRSSDRTKIVPRLALPSMTVLEAVADPHQHSATVPSGDSTLQLPPSSTPTHMRSPMETAVALDGTRAATGVTGDNLSGQGQHDLIPLPALAPVSQSNSVPRLPPLQIDITTPTKQSAGKSTASVKTPTKRDSGFRLKGMYSKAKDEPDLPQQRDVTGLKLSIAGISVLVSTEAICKDDSDRGEKSYVSGDSTRDQDRDPDTFVMQESYYVVQQWGFEVSLLLSSPRCQLNVPQVWDPTHGSTAQPAISLVFKTPETAQAQGSKGGAVQHQYPNKAVKGVLSLHVGMMIKAIIPQLSVPTTMIAMRMLDKVATYSRYSRYWKSRPAVSVHADPAAWWRHAGSCVVAACRSQFPGRSRRGMTAEHGQYIMLYTAIHGKKQAIKDRQDILSKYLHQVQLDASRRLIEIQSSGKPVAASVQATLKNLADVDVGVELYAAAAREMRSMNKSGCLWSC